MELPVIYIFTHDSIGVGEDGLTHQPVGQPRPWAIPGLIVLRPADANEAIEAWRIIEQLPRAGGADSDAASIAHDRSQDTRLRKAYGGAYVLADADDRKPQVLLLATGSEVSLCLEAYEKLKAEDQSLSGEHALMGDVRALLRPS